MWPFTKSKTVAPRTLDSFFADGRCPDCGEGRWSETQDGGHDALIECEGCHHRFGVNFVPFNLIERVG